MKIGKETIHMADGLESSLQPRTPENQQNVPRAHLVTSKHLMDADQLDSVRARLSSGDLNAHVWPAETAEKLKSSNPQPNLLVVDGMSAQQPGKPATRDFDSAQRNSLWRLMPARPSDINSSGEVFYVLGDVVKEGYDEVLKPFYSRNASDQEARNKIMAVISKNRPEIDSVASYTSPDPYISLPSLAAVGVALIGAVNLTEERAEKRDREPLNARKYARRSILKLATFTGGMGVAAYGIHRFGPKISVAKDIDDNIIDTMLKVARREKLDHVSDDGRTAFMIEKGIFAAQRLGETDVTVLAGTEHEHNKDILLSYPQARGDAAVKYANVLLKIVDEASKEGGFSEETKLAARGILLDNLLYGQILRATDPGTAKVSPNEVDQTLDKSIKFQSDFMISNSPLSQAVDALRQGAPKVVGPFG